MYTFFDALPSLLLSYLTMYYHGAPNLSYLCISHLKQLCVLKNQVYAVVFVFFLCFRTGSLNLHTRATH
jgi:hypothetical protein